MTRLLHRTYRMLQTFGMDPRTTLRSIAGLPSYFRDLTELKSQRRSATKDFPLGAPYPCLQDRLAGTGPARGHYFHQDLLVARRVHLHKPSVHVDVGSRIDGFVAHLASFRPVDVFDIRPLTITIPNIRFIQADLMAPLGDTLVDYCDSLSCLHALEHFGLGRYGDPVNYDGYIVGLNNLRRLLKTGGTLYLSVPIGPQRIEFNAHRVFSLAYLLECLADQYHLDHFSFVDDEGDLHEDMHLTDTDVKNNCGCIYGCGIFEMTKL